MAAANGVDIGLEDPGAAAGAVFRLTGVDSDALKWTVNTHGARVEIHPGAQVVTVSLPEIGDDPCTRAHDAAQEALDLAAYLGRGVGVLRDGHEQLICWWRDGNGVTLRQLVTKHVGITIGPVTIQVRDREGNVRPPDPTPEPVWTPALRYFRYAQAAEDVFDAYRNTYLALEAALSVHVLDGPSGERDWLRFALRDVDQRGIVSVRDALRASDPHVDDPVDAFVDRHWRALRSSTFHAKSQRPVRLPGGLTDGAEVEEALERLTSFVVRLLTDLVKAPRPGGGMTYIGFETLFVAPKIETLELRLEGEEVDPLQIETRFIGQVDESSRREGYGFLGTISTTDARESEFSTLHATAPVSNQPLDPGPLDQRYPIIPMSVAGVDTAEILLVFTLENRSQPRQRFSR